MRGWGYFLFFASFFALYLAGSMYAAWRITDGLKIAVPHSYYVFAAAAFMAAMSTLAYFCSTLEIDLLISFLGPLGGMWMGVVGISVTVLFFNDLLNFAALPFKIKDFRYYSTAVSLSLIFAMCLFALINAAFILKVKDIKIKVPELKTDKVSIALLADLHINIFTPEKSIRKIVEIANGLDTDIVVIAGDLIDTDISQNAAAYGLDKFKAKYGVFAVTGNHEYYTGIEKYVRLCEDLGYKLLRNESYEIENIITLAGINDKQGRKQGADLSDTGAALANINAGTPVIFISHRPDNFDEAAQKGVKLVQLSGHVHAGQIPPMEFIVRAFKKYYRGVYEKNGSYMYLTSGARWWGPPMRLFNTSEIVKITLEK